MPRRGPPTLLLLLLLWAVCVCSSLPAQDLPAQDFPVQESALRAMDLGDNRDALIGLQRAEAMLSAGQWRQAVDTLRRLMETEGDALAPVASKIGGSIGFVRHLPVRKICQIRIGETVSRSPDGLADFRRLIDPTAERQLAAAGADIALLRRLLATATLSKSGDEALLRLGDILLEQGRYNEARAAWEQIAPSLRTPATQSDLLRAPPGVGWWRALQGVDVARHEEALKPLLTHSNPPANLLVHPDPQVPLADVWARLAMASLLEGSRDRARLELELLRMQFPEAQGKLGGAQGRWTELLEAELRASADWPSADPPSDDWPTFAGAMTRQRVMAAEADPAGTATWRQPLAEISNDSNLIAGGRLRVGEPQDMLLSHFPIVVDGKSLYCDYESIYAIDMNTGAPAFSGGRATGAITTWEMRTPPTWQNHLGSPRFTLTARGDKVYARLGSPVTGVSEEVRVGDETNQLVGVDLSKEGALLEGFPLKVESPEWAFEGAPVVDDASLYVAMRRTGDVAAQSYVACYELGAGRLKWRTRIGSAEGRSRGNRKEITQTLLTLAEGVLYVNTNLGAVAAVSTEDGAIRWAMTYPRRDYQDDDASRSGLHFFRELTPCVYYRGLLISAPADCDRIFAVEAATGRLAWATGREMAADAVQLLGVGEGGLIASGAFLYWIDIYTGRLAARFPENGRLDLGHARPQPSGCGRGVLCEDKIYWPTTESVYVFDQKLVDSAGGRRPLARRTIEMKSRWPGYVGANLIVTDGVLLAAGPQELAAFHTVLPQVEIGGDPLQGLIPVEER